MDDLPENLERKFTAAVQDTAVTSEDRVRTADVDEEGHFRIEIESGEWDVSVEVEDATILFRGINL